VLSNSGHDCGGGIFANRYGQFVKGVVVPLCFMVEMVA